MQTTPNSTPDYGVINEQGFVAGNGLGFNPFDENELNGHKAEEKDTEKENEK